VGETVSVELEIEMLEYIGAAIDEHAIDCERRPKVILLHPGNHELIGWDEVFGLPVLPDPRVEPKRFKLVCGEVGTAGVLEGKIVWWDADGHAYCELEVAEGA
jgi:hypothetical protein